MVGTILAILMFAVLSRRIRVPKSRSKKKRAAENADEMVKQPRLGTFTDVKTFFFKKGELRELSNFADIPVLLDNVRYPTGEHCFHARKYLHSAARCCSSAREQELKLYAKHFETDGQVAANGLSAKRAGGKKGMALTDLEMKGWTAAAEAIQLKICQDKASMHAVQTCLLGTADAYLLHQDNRAKPDTPWGGKIPRLKEKLTSGKPIPVTDVVGQNRLGLIWMKVRESLKIVAGSASGKLNDSE